MTNTLKYTINNERNVGKMKVGLRIEIQGRKEKVRKERGRLE